MASNVMIPVLITMMLLVRQSALIVRIQANSQ